MWNVRLRGRISGMQLRVSIWGWSLLVCGLEILSGRFGFSVSGFGLTFQHAQRLDRM